MELRLLACTLKFAQRVHGRRTVWELDGESRGVVQLGMAPEGDDDWLLMACLLN